MTTDPASPPPGGLRILFVSTKPPFPPSDGGRLLMWNTIVELAARGHRITFVAPDLNLDNSEIEKNLLRHCEAVYLDSARVGHLAPSLLGALLTGQPLSIIRHSHPAVRHRVAQVLERETYDVIHAEQFHALANLPRSGTLPPVVLRAQNVESQLWRMVADVRPKLRWVARREAKKLAAFESRAIRMVSATIALTRPDGDAFAAGVGLRVARIRVIPPPFPTSLPASEQVLPGDPALCLIGGGWLPNKDSISWFFESIWDDIRRANPSARVHVFGDDPTPTFPSKTSHRSPSESKQLFRKGAILVVPLRVASGIRMKILEAWARGIPVVATPEAVSGLDARDGHEVMLASNGKEFAEAIRKLRTEPELKGRLTSAGRESLAQHHDCGRVAALIEETYRDAIDQSSG